MMEDVNHVRVPRHNPSVQERIPMHRIFVTQPVVQRIGIGQDFRVQQMVKAQRLVSLWRDEGARLSSGGTPAALILVVVDITRLLLLTTRRGAVLRLHSWLRAWHE